MTQERFIAEVRQQQEPLRRFLLALCAGNGALADDIAQDALVRAYVASGSFLGLLQSGDSSDRSFRYQQLYLALEKLPEKEKAAIALFYFEDRSIKEISAILDMPQGTVKYQLSMGRQHLKQHIQL